jgi:hypothetical protein
MESATANLAPRRCPHPHHFDIARSDHGLWRVEDRERLIGGIFRTRKDAIRFAMFETDGDRTCIHFRTGRTHAARQVRSSGRHQS